MSTKLQADPHVTSLTPPEAEIMRVVWDLNRPVTVRDVYEPLRDQKRIAYTTVMSVMTKLAKKGVLVQDTSSAAYLYTATVTDEEIAGAMVESVIDRILAGAAEPVISRLLGVGRKKRLSKKQLAQVEEILARHR